MCCYSDVSHVCVYTMLDSTTPSIVSEMYVDPQMLDAAESVLSGMLPQVAGQI